MADPLVMIDPSAPDPFSIESWVSNLIPTEDPEARTWWLASMAAAAHGDRHQIVELAITFATGRPAGRA